MSAPQDFDGDAPEFESDDCPPVVRGESHLVPNRADDDIEIIKGTIWRGQEALSKFLEDVPSLVRGAAKGKIAESVARAQNILSEANARMEKLAIEKEAAFREHEREMAKLNLDSVERAERLKNERLELIISGIEKVTAAAAKLHEAGLSRAKIGQITASALDKLVNQLEEI